jgi:glycosyltransferase involved in cell wall biosynthesis
MTKYDSYGEGSTEEHSGLSNPGVSISVIMPVYNGVDFIRDSLPPLVAMLKRGEIEEVLVVDDGSTDSTVQLAEELGARVMSSGGRLGPGGARNKAAKIASADALWFVDADVIVHEDAARNIREGFADDHVVAVFGSYDDQPPAQNFFSQYKNLVHHFYHQRANEEASTFWSGCGAVLKSKFLTVDGFDVDRYKYPSIEDIELGHRLIEAGGKIRLRHAVKCTHLKVWRFGNLVHTEIFRRAIPWSRLILTSSGLPNDLNTGFGEQARAGLAGLLLLSVLAWLIDLAPAMLPVIFLALAVLVNLELVKLFFKRKGLLFAVGGLLFHQVYYLYSAASFVAVYVEQLFLKLFAGSRS